MPSPCSTNSTSGKEAPPWETRYAGPERALLSTGVWIVAVPITDSGLQAAGFDPKTAARHAFCRVDRREGRLSGSCRSTLAMLACPRPLEVSLTMKAVPSSLLACPPAVAVRVGSKGRASQPESWKCEETASEAPWAPVRVPVISLGSQLVGLNSKFGRSTVTWRAFRATGTPLTNWGRGSLEMLTAAVSGLTVIWERTSTFPRLKGPATAGVTSRIPKGAPP